MSCEYQNYKSSWLPKKEKKSLSLFFGEENKKIYYGEISHNQLEVHQLEVEEHSLSTQILTCLARLYVTKLPYRQI